jgi:hypothetical protein
MIRFDGSVGLCPVELKGRNVKRGLRQLEVAIRALGESIVDGRDVPPETELRACLLSTASEPYKSNHYRRARESLEKLLGTHRLLVKTGLPRRAMFDLGPFLRS